MSERERLAEDARRAANWKRWGPYLSERQWGTVREDYSEDGDAWAYFPHEHARSRAYRWGEDGLLGFTDRQCRLCFSLALWNGADPILKERLFGLSGPEGNHGEDVKELYFYQDATPTSAYCRAMYRYPQAEFPYAELIEVNRRRSRADPEYELGDTGAFAASRTFDVSVEYAKASPDDILIRITAINQGDRAAHLHLLPTLWFRNTWSWGRSGDGYPSGKPKLWVDNVGALIAEHITLGLMRLEVEGEAQFLLCGNESNLERLYGVPNTVADPKDAIGDHVLHGRALSTVEGTKASAWVQRTLGPGEALTLRLRLRPADMTGPAFGPAFDQLFQTRIQEADAYYASVSGPWTDPDRALVYRQAAAGLLWSRQHYHYVVSEWLNGDPAQPAPPAARRQGRNKHWRLNLFNRDVISMPDKWEYPWYAAWDLAFHMVPMARLDPAFAGAQLELFVREWYMHPNGQIPAYEWNLGDVNPPVHAWAAWRVYKISAPRGKRDRRFLAHIFQKLLMNFTWWVNRKDEDGRNLFSGGFLGLDNIGVFDRSKPLPGGGRIEQADGTAWMAFFCTTMLDMALELASHDPAYEDLASKFFEHFVGIADAINRFGGDGLWDEYDGFYYDYLSIRGQSIPLRLRSMVGIIPLFAVLALDDEALDRLPSFNKRLRWFLENRADLADQISYLDRGDQGRRLLAIPSRDRLQRVLQRVLDEAELLSPHGVRSLSRHHEAHPYELRLGGEVHRVAYVPGDSDSGMFGGNSNWRGPVWFPVNWLLIEALERYHYFYGDTLKVECPTGSGVWMNLAQVAVELARRLSSLFLLEGGKRPFAGDDPTFQGQGQELLLFHEFFHGDTGRGLGASHQTGWTALVMECLRKVEDAR